MGETPSSKRDPHLIATRWMLLASIALVIGIYVHFNVTRYEQATQEEQVIGFHLRTVIVDDKGISDIVLKPGEHWSFHVPFSGYAPISVEVFGSSVRVFQSIEGREETELPNTFGAGQFLLNHEGNAKYTVWPRDHTTPPIYIDVNYDPRPNDPTYWSCKKITTLEKEG